MGKVDAYSEFRHVFEIENQGASPVQITGVHPECGCMVVDEHDGKWLQPQEKLKVPLKINTETGLGPFDKHVLIKVKPKNGEQEESLSLVVMGDVLPNPSLFLTEGNARFGEVRLGESAEIIVHLARLDTTEVDFEELISEDERISLVKLQPAPELKNGLVVRMKLDTVGLSAVGSYQSRVTLTTSHDAPYHQIVVPVKAELVAQDNGFLPELFFGKVPAGKVHVLDLSSHSPVADTIASVSCADCQAGVQVEVIENSSQIRLFLDERVRGLVRQTVTGVSASGQEFTTVVAGVVVGAKEADMRAVDSNGEPT